MARGTSRLLTHSCLLLLSFSPPLSGDGWNSSYQVARVLAKPFLNVSVRRKGGMEPGALRLPRAKMLIIGGDLAYPSPNETTYETRLFRPFQCAMPPPLNYDPAALSMHKPPIPGGVAGLKDYKGPTCFSIPGNRACTRDRHHETSDEPGEVWEQSGSLELTTPLSSLSSLSQTTGSMACRRTFATSAVATGSVAG